MKQYPSIPRDFQEMPNAYIFAKLDGQNFRAAWNRKSGWNKFGSKKVLIDDTDPIFGPAKILFLNTVSEPIAKILHDNRCRDAIVFCEFWGNKSFAGRHEDGDPKFITLFDAALDKKGILGPRDFLKTFGKSGLEIAHYIGQRNWTRGFIDEVWDGKVEGASFEGVVGKVGEGHKLEMRKAKTKVWIEAVKAKFASKEAAEIIDS